jgi:hypothetical protein
VGGARWTLPVSGRGKRWGPACGERVWWLRLGVRGDWRNSVSGVCVQGWASRPVRSPSALRRGKGASSAAERLEVVGNLGAQGRPGKVELGRTEEIGAAASGAGSWWREGRLLGCAEVVKFPALPGAAGVGLSMVCPARTTRGPRCLLCGSRARYRCGPPGLFEGLLWLPRRLACSRTFSG